MISSFLRRALIGPLALAASLAGWAAAPDGPSVVVGRITATPAHPRNSEGAFVTLKSGRIVFAFFAGALAARAFFLGAPAGGVVSGAVTRAS